VHWSRFVNFFRPWPNQFVQRIPDFLHSDGIPDSMGSDAQQKALGRTVLFCRWVVEPDEALVVTVRPPECAYWNFELNNEWWNTVDYRYRLTSVNGEQAVFNPDGTVVVVLAHEDPGVPNWLDLAGYTSGLLNQRWVESRETPLPEAHLVRFADLEHELPEGTPRISAEWRREQLWSRKIGIDRRFLT
jgi:hypothetical protein